MQERMLLYVSEIVTTYNAEHYWLNSCIFLCYLKSKARLGDNVYCYATSHNNILFSSWFTFVPVVPILVSLSFSLSFLLSTFLSFHSFSYYFSIKDDIGQKYLSAWERKSYLSEHGVLVPTYFALFL